LVRADGVSIGSARAAWTGKSISMLASVAHAQQCGR
jgi:hypothetical protein